MIVPHARSMPAVRMISVWPIGQRADHHHLLEDQREVLTAQEPVALRREEDADQQERDQRPELRQPLAAEQPPPPFISRGPTAAPSAPPIDFGVVTS
jgi:hypothetical protein